MAENSIPVEVIVQGSGSSSRGQSWGRDHQSTALETFGDGDANGEDSGNAEGTMMMSEIEQHLRRAKATLAEEFRLAITDRNRLEDLISQADNHPGEAWSKALLWAAASGHTDFITRFMERRRPALRSFLQIAKDADGFSSLHRAVVMGQKDVVKILMRCSSDAPSEHFGVLHARTPEGWTPLHLAVVTGDEDMVQILIDSYALIVAPPPAEWDFADNLWMTPLHYAVLGNLQRVMQQLLEWPAYDWHVNAHDYYMRTAAHMASCRGDGSIEILVNNPRVDINAVDCCSYTPLHWAVYAGATEAVRCLVSRAGERIIRTTEEDIEGRPVFQTAIENTTMDRKVCKDIEKLLLTCAEVKDEVERLYRDRQVYVDASNAILVGAALIASVTFGGWLQPPGGNSGSDGQADRELQVFWTFNSLSFFFSIATVMAGAGAVLPMEDVYIGRAVRTIRGALGLTAFLLIISVFFVLGAFGASGFASLTDMPNLRQNMTVTTIVGSVVCIIILLWFLQRLYKIRPDWRRIVWPAVEICYTSMMRRRRRRDLVDIQSELEMAEIRARDEIQKKYGRSSVDRYRVDLTDLVFTLGKASDKASHLRKVAHDRAVLVGIADEKGGSLSVRHLKERVLEQRILAFEEAHERARMPRMGTGQLQDASLNLLILSHVSARGLHHWIDEFPTYYCRAHSLKKDATRWSRIYGRVVLLKRPKLEEENTRFEYGMLAFDDWAV